MLTLLSFVFVILQAPQPAPPPVPSDVLSQFDFLDGAWDFTYTVTNPDGTLAFTSKGRWTGRKLADGHVIEDTWVLLDDSGKPRNRGLYTIRAFNRTTGKWQYKSLNVTTGLWQDGTGEKVGTEMHLVQSPPSERTDGNWLRIRYYNITADSFSWIADVSGDGKTWIPERIRIEAKRAK